MQVTSIIKDEIDRDVEKYEKDAETGKKPSKVGRPRAISRTITAKLEEAFRIGATIEDACTYVGIDPATLYREMDRDADFAKKIEISRRYVKLRAKRNVSESIIKGSVEDAKWWLEHKHSDEFSKRPDVAVQVNNFTVDFVEDDPSKE